MTKHFRTIGYLEGISFLALLGIAMPLKYLAGMPMAVRIVGSAHGFLFVLYVFVAFVTGDKYGWPPRKLGMAFVAAIIPFGPFWFERKFMVQEPQQKT